MFSCSDLIRTMESPPVLSSFSWQRRRAWAQRTRHWHTTVDEADATAKAMQDTLETPQQQQDEAFLDGNSTNKIYNWLQDCRLFSEMLPEESCIPGTSGTGSYGNSFEDDLTLGAEARVLPGNHKTDMRPMLANSDPKFLKLNQSFISSSVSSKMNRTCSSVSEILDMCQEDAESILYNLGFACEEPQVTAKIPTRFFQTPSQVKGINFRVFLEAQVHRIELEDPCLTLASRFKQVEALATTANALCCLYSYVSKTPVQKIVPSYSYSSFPNVIIPGVKEEPVSPIDRLRNAVDRMCLYTSQRDRKSLCKVAWEFPTKLSSLEEVVQEVLVMVREDKLRCQGRDLKDARAQVEFGSASENAQCPQKVSPPQLDSPAVSQGFPTGFLSKEAAVISGTRRRTCLPHQRQAMEGLQTEPDLRIHILRNTMEVWKSLPAVITQDNSRECPCFQVPDGHSNNGLTNSDKLMTKGKSQSSQVRCQTIYSAFPTQSGITQSFDDGPILCSLDKTLPLTQRILLRDSSFEMEEVQSNEDEEIKLSSRHFPNDTAVKRRKMNFTLRMDSTHSDSSGFVEDPVPESAVPVSVL
ncbi:protein TESPA1 [Microcaecilia unicolor]|uniref:Protein TESPA1 n=1 Tax=Microcaecilia unicolor TaxID=1415580 RepID=A0A6P7XL01_9AMPH|nr:protein TESPA1 [Microcaecilia unicolor]